MDPVVRSAGRLPERRSEVVRSVVLAVVLVPACFGVGAFVLALIGSRVVSVLFGWPAVPPVGVALVAACAGLVIAGVRSALVVRRWLRSTAGTVAVAGGTGVGVLRLEDFPPARRFQPRGDVDEPPGVQLT